MSIFNWLVFLLIEFYEHFVNSMYKSYANIAIANIFSLSLTWLLIFLMVFW